MKRIVNIGTRDSQLAVWQGKKVQEKLAALNIASNLILIKSDGDINLVNPLYELGVTGIFTKALDVALINGEIDIAVHSYKDVPTTLAKGCCLAAVLERDTYVDLLVSKIPMEELALRPNATIATSSTRRRAQWLHQFPTHQMVNIRGNINSRLKKLLENEEWAGTVLSKAGVDRIDLEVPIGTSLDWMLPAPAQGTVVVVAKTGDVEMLEICSQFNHEPTQVCTTIEKDFLKNLMGGCSTPIGALAVYENHQILFKGNILSLDGTQKAEVMMRFEIAQAETAGTIAAKKIIEEGGESILNDLKNTLN